MPLEYRINGRKVSHAQWQQHLFHDASRQLTAEALQKRVAGIRCPTHGEAPTVAFERDTAKGFEMKIGACCDGLLTRAQEVLNR